MPNSTREVLAQRLAMAEAAAQGDGKDIPTDADAAVEVALTTWRYFGDSYKHLLYNGRIIFTDQLLRNAYSLLGDGNGREWDLSAEYTRGIGELLRDTIDTLDSNDGVAEALRLVRESVEGPAKSLDYDEIAEQQGWNDGTRLDLLREFIGERGLGEALGHYARGVADRENDA